MLFQHPDLILAFFSLLFVTTHLLGPLFFVLQPCEFGLLVSLLLFAFGLQPHLCRLLFSLDLLQALRFLFLPEHLSLLSLLPLRSESLLFFDLVGNLLQPELLLLCAPLFIEFTDLFGLELLTPDFFLLYALFLFGLTLVDLFLVFPLLLLKLALLSNGV